MFQAEILVDMVVLAFQVILTLEAQPELVAAEEEVQVAILAELEALAVEAQDLLTLVELLVQLTLVVEEVEAKQLLLMQAVLV